MLKVSFPDDESEHEHLALQHWHGRGAVQLLRADPHRRAMLLERLHPEDLTDLWDLEACEVVAGLYGRLHVPAPPQLRTLTSYVERWAADLGELPRSAPIPRRLVEQARVAGPRPRGRRRRAPADDPRRPALRERAGRRPRALAGHRPQADVAATRTTSWRRCCGTASTSWPAHRGRVRDGVRRRFHTLVDAAGLDEDRARDWVVVRMVLNALWAIQDAAGSVAADAGGGVGLPNDREWITMCITIAKAVQD